MLGERLLRVRIYYVDGGDLLRSRGDFITLEGRLSHEGRLYHVTPASYEAVYTCVCFVRNFVKSNLCSHCSSLILETPLSVESKNTNKTCIQVTIYTTDISRG